MNTRTKYKTQPKNIMYTNHNIFDCIKNRVKAGNNGATVFVPHVCNNIDAFGAGFAAQVAERYPTVKADYHMLGKTFLKNNFGYSQVLKVFEDEKYKHKLFFVNMIAQNGLTGPKNIRPLNYFALIKAMNSINMYIKTKLDPSEKIEIHCPKFGSGLAGGNWKFIENLIEDIWPAYFVSVYEYNKNEK
jgi:hypothetical protein